MASKQIERNKTQQFILQTESDKEHKKINRRSKLFYVTCDYLEVNDNRDKTGTEEEINSEKSSASVNIFVNQNSAAAIRERKKRNRKSKLFYVSYDQINIEDGGTVNQVNNDDDDRSLDSSQEYDCNYSSRNGSLGNITLPSNLTFSSGEGTPTNLSSPSSGCSTPSFRKRPKKPDIKLSDMNKPYKDYIEILRAESLSSLCSEGHEDASNRNSFLDISEDNIAKAFLTPQFQAEMRGDDEIHEFEQTLESTSQQPFESEDKLQITEFEMLCKERPSSPTSEFLSPLLSTTNNSNLLKDLHNKLSPLLYKMRQLEEQAQQASSLQIKIAVLQEEKRQLSTLLQSKRQNETPVKESPTKEVGVQKNFEIITEIAHKCTETVDPQSTSLQVGGDDIAEITFSDNVTQHEVTSSHVSCQYQSNEHTDKDTQTVKASISESCTGNEDPAEIFYASKGIQETPDSISLQTQTVSLQTQTAANMTGTSTSELIETGVGCDVAERFYICSNTQTNNTQYVDQLVQVSVTTASKYVETQPTQYESKSIQAVRETAEFCCGENIAYIKMVDQAISIHPEMCDTSVNTISKSMTDFSIQCNISNPTTTIGVGDGNVFQLFCDRCSNLTTKDEASGVHDHSDQPCCIDDKLCDCIKPQTTSVSVGDHTVNDNFCNRCDQLITETIGVGNHTINDLLCDKCEHLQTADVAIGDSSVDDVICDKCENLCLTKSVAIGDGDVNNSTCEKCEKNEENIFNFDLNLTNHQQPILCHYCGNKVDLNDSSLDDSLQAMRDSMQSISSGMKRTEARKDLNLSLDDYGGSHFQSKESVVVTPGSDEVTPLSDEEEEPVSSHDDVIQACKMLHNHFSEEKPLKQQQMMKYMAVIQSLWFKTVKRRRANASVVKSYIDLYQQRIPELLETILNLSDDEANTALHFALTYKNFGVVSILLDSGECCVDLVNQAGYSPVMLAALTGFERKNDKYIMQRLIRLGNINKESSDTGQTPLMLAVSRGNVGMVELLLDAGCDINAVDDEGSTALMGACEHGNINLVKTLLGNPDCNATIEDNEGSTALSIAMDSRRKDLALLIYGSLNFDARGGIKLSPSKQSLLGLGRRSPSPVIGRR